MDTALPRFEGAPVDTSSLKLTGKAVERVGRLDSGEEVFLIVRSFVKSVNHVSTDVGLERVHTCKAEEVFILNPEDGARMLGEAQMISDERFGLQSIFNTYGGESDRNGEVKE